MITVLADGTFDGLHFGHIAHLKLARTLGDRLIVALATDEAVQQRKGPGRPRFPFAERVSMLRALTFVDEVLPCNDISELISTMFYPGQIASLVYVKGKEYEGVDGHLQLKRITELVESYGGRVAFVGDPLASSTEIIHELGPLTGATLHLAVTRKEVLDWLDKAKAVIPYLLGETIVDRYVHVIPAQKSPKEEIITYLEGREEIFAGGIRAVHHHAGESTTDPVLLWTTPPITKTRYVSDPFVRKVFSLASAATVEPYPASQIPSGLVIVADFGHGLFRQSDTGWVSDRIQFLALTVQSNSLNWGFNLLTKWPRADYFVVDEQELRLSRADRTMSLRDLLRLEHHRLGAKVSAVTLGHNGCLVHNGKDFVELPSLTNRVVDRMGAGDAFLAWTAPLVYVGAPLEVIALVGNIAGAIKVGTVGNKEAVTMAQVKRWVKGILP